MKEYWQKYYLYYNLYACWCIYCCARGRPVSTMATSVETSFAFRLRSHRQKNLLLLLTSLVSAGHCKGCSAQSNTLYIIVELQILQYIGATILPNAGNDLNSLHVFQCSLANRKLKRLNDRNISTSHFSAQYVELNSTNIGDIVSPDFCTSHSTQG